MKQKNEVDIISYHTDGEGVENHTRTEIRNNSEKPKVYLIYDLPDKIMVEDLKKFLIKEGYHIEEPNFAGGLIDRRKKHEINLINADIIIIFYGKENIFWLRTKLLDVLKSPGLGRNKPLTNSIVYTPHDVKVSEEIMINYRVGLISQDDIFPPKSLKEFLYKASTSHAAVTE